MSVSGVAASQASPAAAADEPARTSAEKPAAAPRFDARTRALIEGPIAATLIRLAVPNIAVMLAQTSVGLVETYFIGKLGTDSLAGVALAFPVVMLMQMMSAGAMGGGMSSAIARALGGGRRADANALALHAMVIALLFGLIFTAVLLLGGPWLYTAMGGSGASLAAAVTYSNVIFTGAVLVWLFNSLANVIRGTGNMLFPALVTISGVVVLVPLSPCLIFGIGPFPQLGVAGGAVAVLLYYAVGSLVLAAYLRSGRSVVRLTVSGERLRWPLFADILRVGAVAALITVQTNLTIAIATGLVGAFGPAAIAGYGTGSRLEYLLIPLVFGLGGPLVAMVGTNIGAHRPERALRVAWIGAAIAAAMCEIIGFCAAAAPHAWLSLFGTEPEMIDAGSRYLHTVGPVYGLFGLGMALYFASQGAGRLLWTFIANLARLLIAAGGGYIALRLTGNLTDVFMALAVALAAFGLINAAAVASGVWFDTPRKSVVPGTPVAAPSASGVIVK
jgi:putative MATE family efflux protein